MMVCIIFLVTSGSCMIGTTLAFTTQSSLTRLTTTTTTTRLDGNAGMDAFAAQLAEAANGGTQYAAITNSPFSTVDGVATEMVSCNTINSRMAVAEKQYCNQQQQ